MRAKDTFPFEEEVEEVPGGEEDNKVEDKLPSFDTRASVRLLLSSAPQPSDPLPTTGPYHPCILR